MSTSWSAIQTGMLSWFNSVTGLKAVSEHEPMPFFTGGDFLTLRVQSVQSIGVDESRSVFDETQAQGEEVQMVQVGIRHVTFLVAVDTDNQRPDKRSLKYLEDVLNALSRPSSLDQFRALGLAKLDTSPTVNEDYALGDRMRSRTSFSVRFAYRVTDADPIRLGYIASIDLTTHVADTTGVQLPSSLQLNEAVIP